MNIWDPVQTLAYAATSVRPGHRQLKDGIWRDSRTTVHKKNRGMRRALVVEVVLIELPLYRP